jgi:hypothetical protein
MLAHHLQLMVGGGVRTVMVTVVVVGISLPRMLVVRMY